MNDWSRILELSDFECLGHLSRFDLHVWWHSKQKIEIHVVDLGFCVILRGVKNYYLRGLSEQGELYVRDLDALQDYLHSHFPEVHMFLNHFRDISQMLAVRRMREKNFRGLGQDFDPQQAETRLSKVSLISKGNEQRFRIDNPLHGWTRYPLSKPPHYRQCFESRRED